MGGSMKLLTIANRYNLISILLFFVFAGIILFRLINHQLNEELNEQLLNEQVHISRAMRSLDSIANYALLQNDNMTFNNTAKSFQLKPKLFDTIIFDSIEKEEIPYRAIRFSAQTKNSNYIITLKNSQIEATDLAYSIFISLMLVFGLFSLMLIIMNHYFSKKLWAPFLKTIASIKNFNINNRDTDFKPAETRILEFRELNDSLLQMTRKISNDYDRIKEFSENAAHELHTPLAIIRTKLESLLQSKNLNEQNAQLISHALENAVRLSKLTQTLLLLTKIENRQYEEKLSISFLSVFKRFLELYDEILNEKQIKVAINTEEDFVCEMHPVLGDIMVSNLLNNAIKHNIQNGSIIIYLSNIGIKICNSGEAPDFPTELLFNRFKKGYQSSGQLGLGLALVKEIAETNNLRSMYLFENKIHTIKIEK
jgi:signal transduction histidine kinase